jgi:hypothetical protein
MSLPGELQLPIATGGHARRLTCLRRSGSLCSGLHSIHEEPCVALQQFQAPHQLICAPLICEWVKTADGRMLAKVEMNPI